MTITFKAANHEISALAKALLVQKGRVHITFTNDGAIAEVRPVIAARPTAQAA